MSCATSLADEPANRSSAETAIRASIEAYVAAFNKGDADALAATWSATGEWVSEDNVRLKGRDAILAAARAKFADGPKAVLRVIEPTVRFPTPDVAVEDGTAIVTDADGTTTETTYTAVHVQRDGKWQLESVRETAVPSAPAVDRPLEALSWLVGEWIDAADTATVKMKIEWSMNHRFLVSHFEVAAAGMEPLVGAQIIGFDRARGQIRSWLFDADGTIGEGVWSHDGKQWIVKATQTLQDGTPASMTNIYAPRDANSYAWKSIGRKIGDSYLPNIDEVVVVRKQATAVRPSGFGSLPNAGEIVDRFDENRNGQVDPEEMKGRTRFYLERFINDNQIDPNKPIANEKLIKLIADRFGTAETPANSSSKETVKP